VTSPTGHVERLLRVYLVPWGNKFAARGVGAEYPGFPGRAELSHGLEEGTLVLTSEDALDDGAGNGLGAASRRELGLFGSCLIDHNT
jgi:hypothetical protein